VLDQYTALPAKTWQALKAAQDATIRYKNLENAVADGYTDINVVVQNTGFHYMKAALAKAAKRGLWDCF
jgi:endonuclease III